MKTVSDKAVLQSLESRLRRLDPGSRRRWGAMTAHQKVVHVADGTEAVLKRRQFSVPAGRPRRLLKFLALYAPVPWPRSIRTGADPAGRSVDAADFASDVERAVLNMRQLADAPATDLVDAHPMFRPMSRGDWHRWCFLHMDHHLRQFGL